MYKIILSLVVAVFITGISTISVLASNTHHIFTKEGCKTIVLTVQNLENNILKPAAELKEPSKEVIKLLKKKGYIVQNKIHNPAKGGVDRYLKINDYDQSGVTYLVQNVKFLPFTATPHDNTDLLLTLKDIARMI